MLRYILYFSVCVLIAVYSKRAHAADVGTIFIKGTPKAEVSKGDLKDAMIDSDNKGIAWKCDQVYRDEIKANIRTQAGTSVFVMGSLSGEKSKFKVYKALKADENAEWFQCKRQIVDKVTGNVRAR